MDMQGFAISNDILELYKELIFMSKEERVNNKFALFVSVKGFLDSEQALEYIKANMG